MARSKPRTSYYNTEVIGRRQQDQLDAGLRNGHANLPGQLDHPQTVVRGNRHGFVVITKHYSAESVAYALTEAL